MRINTSLKHNHMRPACKHILTLLTVFITVHAMAARPAQTGAGDVAVRTNALAIPLLNMGLEVAVAAKWTLGADWYYPWIPRANGANGADRTGRCLQALAASLEGRYWFTHAFTGHSVGAFGMAGKYDLERNFHGYQGQFGSFGIDYMYAVPIFRNSLRLEFSLGLGFFLSRAREYRVYEPGGPAYTEKDMAKDIHYFGPVKAGVSIVVPITITRKKGGGL